MRWTPDPPRSTFVLDPGSWNVGRYVLDPEPRYEAGVQLWAALTRQLFTLEPGRLMDELELLRDQVERQLPDGWWQQRVSAAGLRPALPQ